MGSDDQSGRLTDDDNNDFYELSCKLATLPESGNEEVVQPPAVSAEFRAGVLIGVCHIRYQKLPLQSIQTYCNMRTFLQYNFDYESECILKITGIAVGR